jgi:hypothetical protein
LKNRERRRNEREGIKKTNSVGFEELCLLGCYVLQEPHDVTSQKTPFFIDPAVETSDLISVAFSQQTNYTDRATAKGRNRRN